jgi:hypothetical protein
MYRGRKMPNRALPRSGHAADVLSSFNSITA